jgi:transposase InsO family protein
VDRDRKEKIALWRLGVLGPLISARLEHGDRAEYYAMAAERLHEHPDGRLLQLSPRTVEDWYRAYRRGGFLALFPADRADRGQTRAIRAEVADFVLRAKKERPRRSIKRIIRMLERAHVARPGELSRSSVHRLLAAHGVSARPVRGPEMERRSFIMEHAGDLWIGDALHGPMVIAPGSKLRKAYLLSQIDCACRYLPHSYWALSEGDAEQEHGLKQAILKYGVPRAYYVDQGSAYTAGSLRLICADLGIHLLHTGRGDAAAKGAIERWHRTWRDEFEDELDGRVLTLDELNELHWAWLGAEYHARKHDTTGRIPREHWLDQVQHMLPVPKGKNLDEVFLHRDKRTVRKDGTIRFRGRWLEVRPELVGKVIELRFDPNDPAALPRVFEDGHFVCDTVPLDRIRNATRPRRRIAGDPVPTVKPTGLDPLALIADQHYRRTRPFGAAAEDPDHDTDHNNDPKE